MHARPEAQRDPLEVLPGEWGVPRIGGAGPTPDQFLALRHMTAFDREYGRAPTRAELATLMGRTRSAAQQLLKRLERDGFIRRTSGQSQVEIAVEVADLLRLAEQRDGQIVQPSMHGGRLESDQSERGPATAGDGLSRVGMRHAGNPRLNPLAKIRVSQPRVRGLTQ